MKGTDCNGLVSSFVFIKFKFFVGFTVKLFFNKYTGKSGANYFEMS